MKRIVLFLVVLSAALVSVLLLAAWYLTGYRAGNASMAGLMGQMMGNQYAYGMTTPIPTYLWVVIASLLVLTVVGVGGLAYYLAFPEIKTGEGSGESAQQPPPGSENPMESWAVLLRTSKPEEKKVLEVLASHDGRYLQKFVVKEAGLSRLQTHRIVSRFAERGIIIVSKSGNTNELALAPWLKPDAVPAGTT